MSDKIAGWIGSTKGGAAKSFSRPMTDQEEAKYEGMKDLSEWEAQDFQALYYAIKGEEQPDELQHVWSVIYAVIRQYARKDEEDA
ncbi:MAG: hypothetical protein LBD02_01335 [Christensenellaceae bacterium]|jgi:hypothetical protein|nr:hypothetical protein [Christensenellaceae bacterium]